MTGRTLQHHADRREDLPEVIMQIARDRAEDILLHRNQLLRQIAALRGQRLHASEELPVVVHQIKAGEQDHDEHRGEKNVHIALHAAVEFRGANGGGPFAFVVLHQQARDRRAQRGLSCLQRQADLRAGFADIVRAAFVRESVDAVERVPELAEGIGQITPLVGRQVRQREFVFAGKRVFQIGPDAAELRRPCRERIGLLFVEHVAHGERERVEPVLDAQQQQRIGAIAVDGFGLQLFQTAELQHRVTRVHAHREQRRRKTGEEPESGRRSGHLEKGSIKFTEMLFTSPASSVTFVARSHNCGIKDWMSWPSASATGRTASTR